MVSNLLPATGPVAGGGDQGRDFETFRTYLSGSLRFSRGFIGLASADTVVFACTLQREDVQGKIKDDLTSICTQGTPVQAVYFLCTEPVKVSIRHDLQAWATAKFGVALEVLDGRGDRASACRSRDILDCPDVPPPACRPCPVASAREAGGARMVSARCAMTGGKETGRSRTSRR